MAFATICASHTPLLHEGVASDETRQRVRKAFASMAATISKFEPDLIVQFSPDHFNGFFYDMMPAFCIGTAAQSIGDWDTRAGPLPVASEESAQLTQHLLREGIDITLSLRMTVDHGFVQIWEEMFGAECSYPAPLIPIFVNSAAPPLPSYRRARALGEAVGRWAAKSGKRILFAASGGLSHDPPTPDVRNAPEQTRERLIAGHNPSAETIAARKEFVLAAGELASRGEPPCQPLNPAWDQEMIQWFRDGDMFRFDHLDPVEVRRLGGRGANEMLAWVSAFAAQSTAGPAVTRCDFYEAIDGWIAGMAMMSALPE